jgi:polyisoprenoid-binding protein YceI
MKKFLVILSAFFILTAFTADNFSWNNDDAHSQVGFTVKHLGISDVSGTFNDFDVKIQSLKPDFSDAKVEFSAKVASIDTRVEARDNHLKSPDFFNAEKYPELRFTSKSLKKMELNKYKLTGNLSLNGITREVQVDMEYKGSVENAMNKKQTAGFQVTGTIKRSDFNLGNGFPPPMISDVVRIKADGEFIQ